LAKIELFSSREPEDAVRESLLYFPRGGFLLAEKKETLERVFSEIDKFLFPVLRRVFSKRVTEASSHPPLILRALPPFLC